MLVISSWVLSCVFSIPMLIINKQKILHDMPMCWITLKPWHWQIYFSLVTVAVFVIPAIIIAVCYAVIVRIIWNKSKEIRPAKRVTNFKMGNIARFSCRNGQANNNVQEVTSSSSASSRGVIPLAKVKTIKMTFVIVLMFVLCWSPYFIYNILSVYGVFSLSQRQVTISIFIQMLAPLNSAANPLIYGIFSSRICNNLRRIPACNYILELLCRSCLEDKRHERITSMCSTYSTIGGDSLKHTPRSTHVDTRILSGAGHTNVQRRQSGPPCVRKSLTQNETDILMNNINNEEQEETRTPLCQSEST